MNSHELIAKICEIIIGHVFPEKVGMPDVDSWILPNGIYNYLIDLFDESEYGITKFIYDHLPQFQVLGVDLRDNAINTHKIGDVLYLGKSIYCIDNDGDLHRFGSSVEF